MTANRYREWFRNIEFFHGLGGWYFLSPDEVAIGPYRSERDAALDSSRLARLLKDIDDKRTLPVVVELTATTQDFRRVRQGILRESGKRASRLLR